MTRVRHILGIDIGGTGLKAAVIDTKGKLVSKRVRTPTPRHCPPKIMVKTLAKLVAPLPAYDHIAIGFPGVVRDGHVLTAPNLGTKDWAGFALARALSKALKAPARMINDADMQGLAVVRGRGIELVVTLGTGIGTALFDHGKLAPHMELAHHPLHSNKTYDEYLGDHELKKIGRNKWSKRVLKTIGILHTLLNYDHLYLGGGNAKKLTGKLPARTTRVSNTAGVEGGAALWRMRTFY
ncbi:MAG TPA: ROK family protein [Rhizomicrobium sp.]|jgi:polyphosphate glucokinase|nr:ROK family protein [Rhizomicrobium sp.]